MGALANAAQLRVDPTFRDWVTTACVYVARGVIIDDSTAPVADQPVRAALARQAAFTPDTISPLFVASISCDPNIAKTYSAVDPTLEQLIIDHVINGWTIIAKLLYPNGA